MIRLISPTGSPIVGTLENITGCANVSGFTRLPDGTLDPEYDGNTDVFWDEQRTIERDGKMLLLAKDGEQWTADECTEAAA